MREFHHDIKPGTGLGELLLGSSQDTVREILGEPPVVREEDYGDGVNTHIWEYEALCLELSFSEDDHYRLGTIATSYDWTGLAGYRIVGVTEAQLLESEFGVLGPPALEDDFEEFGKDYAWGEVGLSCWVTDGLVVSVTIMPIYDDTGNIPQWPTRVG